MFKKKKARYIERKFKKNDRDVMSYEDMPLDDYEQEKTEISPVAVKKILLGVALAVVLGLVVFAVSNRDKLTPENLKTWWTYDVLGNAGNGFPVDIVGSEVSPSNFDVSQGRTVYASDTSFVTLNSTGSEVSNVQLRYSSPALKSNGGRYITYGIGGNGYQVLSFDRQLYEGDMTEKIFTGDIASNGNYCLVTEGNGYLSSLYAFDNNNNRIFKYSFSEYYITSVAINNDGTGCVACGLTTKNGEMEAGIYVLDFKSEEPKSVYKITDDTILDSKYIGGNRVALVGKFASYIIKIGEDKYVTNSYEDKTLANYCFNKETNTYTLALSRSGDGRSCMIVQYNNNGDKRFSIDTNYQVDSISTYKGVIGILDGNTAYVFDSQGNQLHKADTGTGSQKIVLTDENNAFVLSVNQIRLIKLEKNQLMI